MKNGRHITYRSLLFLLTTTGSNYSVFFRIFIVCLYLRALLKGYGKAVVSRFIQNYQLELFFQAPNLQLSFYVSQLNKDSLDFDCPMWKNAINRIIYCICVTVAVACRNSIFWIDWDLVLYFNYVSITSAIMVSHVSNFLRNVLFITDRN